MSWDLKKILQVRNEQLLFFSQGTVYPVESGATVVFAASEASAFAISFENLKG